MLTAMNITVTFADETFTFVPTDITSRDHLKLVTETHLLKTFFKPVSLHEETNLVDVAMRAKAAGFTHYNHAIRSWAAVNPHAETEEDATIIFLGTRHLINDYPNVPVTSNLSSKEQLTHVHVSLLGLCVQATFDPFVRKRCVEIADPSLLTYLVVNTPITELMFTDLISLSHPVWKVCDSLEQEQLMVAVGENAPGHMVASWAQAYAAAHTPTEFVDHTVLSQPTEMMIELMLACHHRELNVDWDLMWTTMSGQYSQTPTNDLAWELSKTVSKSKQAELDIMCRSSVHEPLSSSEHIISTLEEQYGSNTAHMLISEVLRKPHVPVDVLELFGLCDDVELRTLVAGHPRTSQRLRTLIATI